MPDEEREGRAGFVRVGKEGGGTRTRTPHPAANSTRPRQCASAGRGAFVLTAP
jgi:hypothetical protein